MLNAGQQAGADTFFEFLLSDDPEMIISGPGGVGKTTLMSHLIDVIMPRYYEICKLMDMEPLYDEVEMTATTNKAAEVLAEATSRPTKTIHSFLNLKVTDDYSAGKQKLEPTLRWTVHERKIIFIDECSMIDTPLINYIRKGTQGCKIVYVGDHCQLAPIMEPLSPVFTEEKPFVQLLEPMRNNGQPALMAICQQLRETVETGEFKPLHVVPGVIDHLDDEGLQRELANHFTVQNRNNRVLAYTNDRVMQYNSFIREELRQLPPEFTVGEYLVNNSAIQMKNRMMACEEELMVIDRKDKLIELPIQGDVKLKLQNYTLRSSIGDHFENVLVPVDRSHFAELVKYYRRTKDWHRYFQLKNTYPDLRPRDASTFHKSQGSTYDTVFIDLGNLSTCHQPNVVARMLYVALTRAKSRIFLYGQLAPKYGGLVI